MIEKKTIEGFCVVVLDRGFVYVGPTKIDGDFCLMTGARNIRVWGTSKGLAELVNGGPTPKTVLDAPMTIRIPMRAVIHLIDTEESKWKAAC